MSSGPDLFVVCKSCGSEVSTYITECPYCGTRVRKRAPKLERARSESQSRVRRPSLGRLKRGEIPGIRPDRRPYATVALVVASVIISFIGVIVTELSVEGSNRLAINTASRWSALVLMTPIDGEWWRIFTTQFIYDGIGYEVVALAAIVLFGVLLERRYGWWVSPLVFVVGGGAGMALVAISDTATIATGGNAAALAFVSSWAIREVLDRRRGGAQETDLLGVLAISLLLVCLPLAYAGASPLAGLGGGVAGIVIGLGLVRLR